MPDRGKPGAAQRRPEDAQGERFAVESDSPKAQAGWLGGKDIP
jgi:hypothetical protein